MRRLASVAAGLAMSVTMVFAGTAAAAPSHFKRGEIWTLSFPSTGFCEVQTLPGPKKFTADNGDAGFIHGASHGAKKITEEFLDSSSGPLAGSILRGQYSKTNRNYSGTIYVPSSGQTYQILFVAGATS